MYMGKVFFSFGEIVVSESLYAGLPNDDHDTWGYLFEKKGMALKPSSGGFF